MPLSRLDNFLKNVRGNILYVNPNDLDATDSIENQGNSLTRPFKTIQRALVESARFSYQKGLDNDRFGKTTILLYPGEHIVDNRPGWIPDGADNYRLRDGNTSDDFPAWSLSTNFDLTTSDNALYKMNSVYGGVILPRGTSLVGFDLRKTKIRPKYVPNPENDAIERSAIFRVTGSCYLWQLTIFDGNPNGSVYKDYTVNKFVPNFSHHKLTVFEYADGVNDVKIDDAFISDFDAARTDLDMYYEKVGLAYGPSSGREIEPDYPSSGLDIQPSVNEYRIVGPMGGAVGISSIKAGDGSTTSTIITVTATTPIKGLDVDTAFQIEGITADGYSGNYVVSDVVSSDSSGISEFKYQVLNAPVNPLPSVTGSTISLEVDTVTSASPYVFNCSLRSVYGMCGMFADGNNATGFKSMVCAQYTGIGLQKDNNAFVKYDEDSGEYKDSTFAGNENINSDSKAVYKPSYRNYHIKATNDAVIQCVSVFAIGYSEHLTVDSGGDLSVTNSNSNFGSKSLVAQGFKKDAFPRDDVGYLTHIIPPKEIETTTLAVEFDAIDVNKTDSVAGIGSTSRLYLYDQTNQAVKPATVLEGYRVGAQENDQLNVLIPDPVTGVINQKKARIVMPNTELVTSYSGQTSYEKTFQVARTSGISSISSNTLTFTKPHTFIEGESIRVIAQNGHLPDGLDSNTVYYAITSGIGTNQIKIGQTLNDATGGDAITINSKGGILDVVSRVSDKIAGDIGHPVQWDANESQWYITVGIAATDNDVYSCITSLGATTLGNATPRTFIERTPDTRNLIDTVYRARYVLPAGSGISSARPPIDGYVIQESSTVTGATDAEVATFFSPTTVTLGNKNEARNFSFLAHVHWVGNTAYYLSELPHGLKEGSQVEIKNVKSADNPVGTANSGYNGTFNVVGIPSAREFTVTNATSLGTMTSDINSRTTSLPTFTQKKYAGTFQVYRSEEIQEYVAGSQDGIYHLSLTNASNKPSASPFSTERYSQPIQNFYPQTNRDNAKSDPKESDSYAVSSPIGQVVLNELQNSITKETIDKGILDWNIGVGITQITSNTAGTAHTIFTSLDHGLNRVTKVAIAQSGTGYGNGTAAYIYDAKLVAGDFASGVSTVGKNATARIQTNSSGNLVSVKIMDGGTGYKIGDALTIIGVGTHSPYAVGVVTVTNIYDNIGDTLDIRGVKPNSNNEFNTLYRITGVGTDNTIQVASASTIGAASTAGIGATDLSAASAHVTGQALNVTNFNFNKTTGVGVVTTAQRHGLSVDNKVKLGGSDRSLYRGDFIIKKINDQNSFNVSIGIGTTAPDASGTMHTYKFGYASAGGNVSETDENITGRQIPQYAGITTTLSAAVLTESATNIEITNVTNLDLNIGDYLRIGSEIVRVKTTVTGNPVAVFRGVQGTEATTHTNNTVLTRIDCRPIEFHRNSIIRTSGHTFEYVGFGPGNYSTGLPEKQDRSLSAQEELLSQSTKLDGGVNVYTGMNDAGDFYIGNKKVNSSTGKEQVFNTPLPTVTGEDASQGAASIGFNVITPLEVTVSRSLAVEGGPNSDIISEFDGPVVFTNKLTSTSTKGIEATSLFLQGDATVSRKQTIGVGTPSLSGNPGDITYFANPTKGGYTGWIYTTENDWYRYGNVSISTNTSIQVFDGVGIGTTTPGVNSLQVGAGASLFAVDGTGVGIGTTSSGFKLSVVGLSTFVGNVEVTGIITATSFKGDGSALTNLDDDSQWSPTPAGLGTGIYPLDLKRVGIGTTVPHYNLDVGTTGTGTTDIYVRNTAIFAGFTTTKDLQVGGALSATTYNLDSSSSNIVTGIVTASTLNVGSALTTTSGNKVGLGTGIPRSTIDLEGLTRFKTYHENVEVLDISSGVVTIDLAIAQSFKLTVDEAVTSFTLKNPPSGSTAFSVKILQDSTGYSVGIDTFKDVSGTAIPVKWPAAVVPTVTTTAEKTDIYSFMIFDGDNITDSGEGLYGIVGGQNFA
tara:strand:+ start:151 stop:6066 length:5916 start_codon:yes stop_codon:yes gene_type:complete